MTDIKSKGRAIDRSALDLHQIKSLIPYEIGITKRGGAGFVIPSEFAKKNLYYISWEGLYECNEDYCVNRPYLDNIFVLQVLEGSMKLTYFNKEYDLPEGSLFFLNLRYPHFYRATSKQLKNRQMLLHGPNIFEYYKLIAGGEGLPAIFEKNSKLSFLMHSIESELQKDFPNWHQVSILIQSMFAAAASMSAFSTTNPVEHARDYIRTHFRENISLDDVSSAVSLNKSYLTRIFKKETGTTPWDYLVSLRLRHAMHLLTETRDSVEEIGAACGFNSTSHFIRSFKGETHLTPKQFRSFFSLIPMSAGISAEIVRFDGL